MKGAVEARQVPFTHYLLRSGGFLQIPIRIIDVGARGGPEPHWDIYGNQIELIAFEPDAKECQRLNEFAQRASRCEVYHPFALWRDKGLQTLFITDNLQASSLLRVNSHFVDRFPHSSAGSVVATTQVATTDLDSFLNENGVNYIDFMKIDAEGAELAILEGANHFLSESLLGLSVEAFFQPYHVGRPLFSDIDGHLRRFGFVLFDLEPERWRRKTLVSSDLTTWNGAGQIIWAQALYFRDLAAEMTSDSYRPTPTDCIRSLKLASLAEVFGIPDFAIEVLQGARKQGLLSGQETSCMTNLLAASTELISPPKYMRWIKSAVRAVLPRVWRRRLRLYLRILVE